MPKTKDLPTTLVGLDVETTSLDPTTGDIIEVAAIRYDLASGREVGRYETFCRPRQPVSQEITNITGITQAMVEGATPFSEHIGLLKEFIGSDILLAHNASFDLAYLGYHGLPLKNPVWDTFPLASVAWPSAGSYNLGTLAGDLGIPITAQHRAAADVELTFKLLQEIRRVLSLTSGQHKQVRHLLSASNQAHYHTLFTVSPSSKKRFAKTQASNTSDQVPGVEAKPTGETSLTSVFAPAGAVAAHLADFKERPEQTELAEKLTGFLASGQSALVESAPGAGKTVAYIVACLMYLAGDSKRRAVIARSHASQTDQLGEETIPRLVQAFGQAVPYTSLKARRHYLCPGRFEQFLRQATLSPADAWILIKLLRWYAENPTGDLSQLNLSHQNPRLVYLVSAESLGCRLQCTAGPECCYQRAKMKAREARLILTTHEQLFNAEEEMSDLIAGSMVIIDEVSRLERAAQRASQVNLADEYVAELLAALQSVSTLKLEKLNVMAKDYQQLLAGYQQLLRKAQAFVFHHTEDKLFLLSRATRGDADWVQLKTVAAAWLEKFRLLIGLEEGRHKAAPNNGAGAGLFREAHKFSIQFEQFLEGNEERVQWLEAGFMGDTARLHDIAYAASVCLKPLFASRQPRLLIDNVLALDGNFDAIRERLDLPAVAEYIQPLPQARQKRTHLIIIGDSPLPRSPYFSKHVSEVIQIAQAAGKGKIIALTTSQESARAIHGNLIHKLNKEKIRLLAPGITGGRENSLVKFSKSSRAILLAPLRKIDGLDIPLTDVGVLVIDKAPFPPPNDPVNQTVAGRRGRSYVFEQRIVTEVITKLRHEIARALPVSHRGHLVVIITDTRLVGQAYGKRILENLGIADTAVVATAELVAALGKLRA